jgi:ribosomal protein S18 acetylase RimI-like enzyme
VTAASSELRRGHRLACALSRESALAGVRHRCRGGNGIIRWVTVTLRHATGDEYDRWSVAVWAEYVDDIVASGTMTREAAQEKARREDAELLPDGLATPGHLIFRVEAGGQPIGWIWMAVQNPRAEQGVGFIYDISIDEAVRGRGYGRSAMQLAEEEARRNGLHALALSVFGQNVVARALYSGLGYRETSVQMRKEL